MSWRQLLRWARTDYCVVDVLERYDRRRIREHDRTWWSAFWRGIAIAFSAAIIPALVAIFWNYNIGGN